MNYKTCVLFTVVVVMAAVERAESKKCYVYAGAQLNETTNFGVSHEVECPQISGEEVKVCHSYTIETNHTQLRSGGCGPCGSVAKEHCSECKKDLCNGGSYISSNVVLGVTLSAFLLKLLF